MVQKIVRAIRLTVYISSFASSSKVLLRSDQCFVSRALAFKKLISSCSPITPPSILEMEPNAAVPVAGFAWRKYRSHDRAKLRQAVSWFSRAIC